MLISLAKTLARAKEFALCKFKLLADMEEGAVMSPPMKVALAVWSYKYCALINVPAKTLDKLLPLLLQCQQYSADELNTTKLHLVHNMGTLQDKIDSEYNDFIMELGLITTEILYRT